jgi:hypothetical protein
VLHDGVIGRENDLPVGRVFIEGERWNCTDDVADDEISNLSSDGIDNPGSVISQTRREYRRFDIFVDAPH